MLAVAVYDIKGDPNRWCASSMPLGLLCSRDVRYAIDQGKADTGPFRYLPPERLLRRRHRSRTRGRRDEKGRRINISVQNQFAREVTFQVPFAGFGKGI